MYRDFGADPIVVQKYGGTSVGSIERISSVAARVCQNHTGGVRRIAVVVSAMSGETNRLIDLMEQVHTGARPDLYDMAVSAGEQVSAALVSAALQKCGIDARPFLGFQLGIVTDEFHSRARIQAIDTKRIVNCWAQGQVPVIAGFQGITVDGEITTLGRGGSDTSAVALAAALEADVCEINTDVDGVFSADPRVVPQASLIRELDFSVALEMAALGSKVLHSRCVELAAKFDLPLIVRNSFKPNDLTRTLIMKQTHSQAIEAPLVSGVSGQRNVARLGLFNLSKEFDVIANVFDAIAKAGVNVDIIVHNQLSEKERGRVGFTIDAGDLDRATKVLREQLSEGAFEHEENLAKVSVVGLGMQSHHGVASRMFCYLSEAGIEVKMVSTSEIKISCVIEAQYLDNAVKLLHEKFCEAEKT